MPETPAAGLVKVRVIAAHNLVEDLAEKIAETLESNGYEVIEYTQRYPLRSPEEFRSRVFVAAVPKGNEEK